MAGHGNCSLLRGSKGFPTRQKRSFRRGPEPKVRRNAGKLRPHRHSPMPHRGIHARSKWGPVPVSPARSSTTPLKQSVIQIMPIRVHRLNQPYLPCPAPSLDGLLPGNGTQSFPGRISYTSYHTRVWTPYRRVNPAIKSFLCCQMRCTSSGLRRNRRWPWQGHVRG
jgi:hypothetical protein